MVKAIIAGKYTGPKAPASASRTVIRLPEDVAAPYGRKANGEPYKVSPEYRAKLAANLAKTPTHGRTSSASRSTAPAPAPVPESETVLPNPTPSAHVSMGLADALATISRIASAYESLEKRVHALEAKRESRERVPASASRSPRDTGTVTEPPKGPVSNAEVASALIDWSGKLTEPKASYVRLIAEMVALGADDLPLPSETEFAPAFAKFGPGYTEKTLEGLKRHRVNLITK